MATFLLIHGAWHGGWRWKKLSPLLRGAGHDVYAPTLEAASARSGESLFSRHPETRAQVAEAIANHGEGWRVPPPPTTFGVENDNDVPWLTSRLTPQPRRACEQPAIYAGDPRTRCRIPKSPAMATVRAAVLVFKRERKCAARSPVRGTTP